MTRSTAGRTRVPLITPTVQARFWCHVQINDPDDCWPWIGNERFKRLKRTDPDKARASFALPGGSHLVYRIAYYLHHFVWPGRLLVCHVCDFAPCCNPTHLFLGTNKSNSEDCVKKDRQARGERSCHALITAEDVLKILPDPRSYAVIGADYGIALDTVSSIKNRKSWKHLTYDGPIYYGQYGIHGQRRYPNTGKRK